MIGVGFLTLPMIGRNNGYLSIIGFVVYSAFLSYIANLMLGRAFHASKGKSYADIVKKIEGPKSSLIVLIFLFSYVLSSTGAYFIFCKSSPPTRRSVSDPLAAKFAFNMLEGHDLLPDILAKQEVFNRVWIPFFFVLSTLLSLPKKITALKYMGYVTSVINLGMGVVLIVDLSST